MAYNIRYRIVEKNIKRRYLWQVLIINLIRAVSKGCRFLTNSRAFLESSDLISS